jgi:hypothetical protein
MTQLGHAVLGWDGRLAEAIPQRPTPAPCCGADPTYHYATQRDLLVFDMREELSGRAPLQFLAPLYLPFDCLLHVLIRLLVEPRDGEDRLRSQLSSTSFGGCEHIKQ